jgi:hypothetical protein
MADVESGAAAIGQAQTILYRAKLQILTQQALAALAGVPGLAWTRLYPPSPVIQIVAYDGWMLGRARLERPHTSDAVWVAVPDRGRPLSRYPLIADAAWALVEAAGVPHSGRLRSPDDGAGGPTVAGERNPDDPRAASRGPSGEW